MYFVSDIPEYDDIFKDEEDEEDDEYDGSNSDDVIYYYYFLGFATPRIDPKK